MVKFFKYLCISLIIFNVLSLESPAQIDKSSYYNRGEKFYYNYFYEPINKGDSIKVITMYKIAYDLLKFEKDEETTIEERYISYPEIEINFLDEEGVIKKSNRQNDTIIVDNYKLINSINDYSYGSFVTKLSYQEYTPILYLRDKELVKLSEKKLQTLNLKDFNAKLNLSSPLVCYSPQTTDSLGKYIYPYILDRNASFSSNDILFYFLVKNRQNDRLYHAAIEYLDAKKSTVPWEGPARLPIYSKTFYDKKIQFINNNNEKPVFQIIDASLEESAYKGILELRMTADMTAPGKYKLLLWSNQDKDTLEYPFKIIWENIPFTLRNPQYAADIMYYVLNDDEYDEIKSGSDREILNNIFKWWKKQDPTRFTIYNEAMTEYFRRADYAFFNFKTIYEKDGAKTDRAKIYILKGPPDKIENSMEKTGKIHDIWFYKRLKKKYIFESDKNGIIYLKEIKDIKNNQSPSNDVGSQSKPSQGI